MDQIQECKEADIFESVNREENSENSSEEDKKTKGAKGETNLGLEALIGLHNDQTNYTPNEMESDKKINLSNLRKKEKQLKEKQLKIDMTVPRWMKHGVLVEEEIVLIEEAAKEWELDYRLVNQLQSDGITHFFPIQRQVIPAILNGERWSIGGNPGDICVSSPTGSGKTLTYILPIVQVLIKRVVPRLRALILLPTRNLAMQVAQVAERYTRNTPLRIACITGQHSFAKEQKMLVNYTYKDQGMIGVDHNIIDSAKQSHCCGILHPLSNRGGHSIVDLVVATPGRLVDHIVGTPGFTLQHLKFLVVDEADQLLSNTYQNWIMKIYNAAYQTFPEEMKIEAHPLIPSLHQVHHTTSRSRRLTRMSATQLPLRRMLFSATLTRDVAKLAPLELQNPQFFTSSGIELGVDKRYQLPKTLQEFVVHCNAGDKPLVLLHIASALQYNRILCFTSSLDTTHRLAHLMQLFGVVSVAEISSSLSTADRKSIIRKFREGTIKLLICSDVMARGMDIDQVDVVVNYDPPLQAKGYVHRSGRTGRAGREGVVYNLLLKNQQSYFNRMIKKISNSTQISCEINKTDTEKWIPRYKEILLELKQVLEREKGKASAVIGKLEQSVTDLELPLFDQYRETIIHRVNKLFSE